VSRPPLRVVFVAALSIAAALIFSIRVTAISERYHYKFPCAAGQQCWYTNGPHVNGALDFQIGDPLQSDVIHAMAEGQAGQPLIQSTTCPGLGLGQYVQVVDVFGNTETYGHLASWIVNNAWVLQGDPLAVEGNTGNAQDCAIHLHWEPGGGSPGWVDGTDMSGLTPITTVTSTNSVIGEIGGSPQGQAIRDEYFWLGQQAGNRSWYVVGWTSDNRGPGTGLWMRREGAGYEQTFRHDAGYGCTEGSGIYASDNRPGEGHWVDYCLWDTWTRPSSNFPSASGRRATGYPRTEPSSAYCPSQLAGCVKFQAFYDGYVWMNSWGQVQSVAAPDVDGNGIVDFTGDTMLVAQAALVYPQRYDVGCDVNADGKDDFVTDTMQTVQIALIDSYNRRAYQYKVPGGIKCTLW